MEHTMSRLGIGTKLIVFSVSYAVFAGIATYLYPKIFIIKMVPYRLLIIAGIILLVIGVPFLIKSAYEFTIGFNRGCLITSGVFSLVRNPIYSAWILFLIPGITLFLKSWLLLATPLVAYICFKIFIKEEDNYLEKQFGQLYENYKSRTNELVPCPNFFKNGNRKT